jgi:hypothetical protein
MKILESQRFLEERAVFALAHTCERCIFYDRDHTRCAHGYPSTFHREAAFGVEPIGDATFCKEFELE